METIHQENVIESRLVRDLTDVLAEKIMADKNLIPKIEFRYNELDLMPVETYALIYNIPVSRIKNRIYNGTYKRGRHYIKGKVTKTFLLKPEAILVDELG